MKTLRVTIFEDNRSLREGLAQLIGGSNGFITSGAFANCNRIIQDIQESQPDVILMDIEMPGISGIDAVKMAKEKFPDIKILMATVFEDNDKVFQSICNGAEGYILKNTQPLQILTAIREIFEGGAPMTPSIASKVLKMFKLKIDDEHPENYKLTDREKEILKCLVEGMSYKMAADRCFISIDTISGHVKNIYKKMQVHSKSEAVVKALKNKIVDW